LCINSYLASVHAVQRAGPFFNRPCVLLNALNFIT
jgi:hypothetical protein